ncbi:MAG: hypothetical protein KDA88_05020 [Planctomycetaceae bacterium]|nr:hypothetical protein [Planctomycetaceae bacterium]MCA9029611.1 hypothetical protein [Planctomycetaceae bacterium]MCB9952354.1 hypothetical protein [Planctomycetaceae bacterium]
MFKLPPGTILTVNGRDYFGVGTLCIVKTTIPTREPRRYFYSARDNNGKDLTSRLVEGNAKFGKNGLGFSFVDMRPKCYAVIEFEPETVAQAPVQIQAIQAPEDSERMAELPSVFHFRNTDIRIHEVGANLPFDYQGLPPTLEFASKTIPDELANRTIVKATLTLTIERTGHATDARVVDLCHDVPIELHPEANILIGRVDLANLVGTAFDNYLNDEFRAHVDPKAYNYEINGVLALQDVAGNKTVLSKLANQIRVRVTK